MEIVMRSQAFRPQPLFAIGAALIVVVWARIHAQTLELGVTDRVVIASKIYVMVQQLFAHWDGAPQSEVQTAYRAYIDELPRTHRVICSTSTMGRSIPR
jgi:hypothetical protein